jgi:hypothetical protein
MKSKFFALLLIFSLVTSIGCGLKQKTEWGPYIGCSEEELYRNWGHGGDSSWYDSEYGSVKKTWYNKTLLFGIILPGYSSEPFRMNILVSNRDGKIGSLSYH